MSTLTQYEPTNSHGYVWDLDLLDWVPEQQPIIEGGTVIVGTVNQGTGGLSPWLVTGTVTVGSATVTVNNGAGASAVNIQDGGNSITVDGSVSAAVTGTVSVSSGSVTVANASGGSAVNIQDGGNSITVDGSVSASVSGSVTVSNGSGGSAVNIQDGGNTITVDGAVTVSATDLDIRNLVFATDKVDASGTTLGSNSGTDIGDVTINNAAGAAAVNIQDGGNTITVDGSVSAAVTGTVTANAGSNLNTSLLALESGGNLATVVTNTTPFVTSTAGGYIRQDSTATMALETGGNLATVATNTAPLITAQGATSTSVKGPMVQGLSAFSAPICSDSTIIPMSISQDGRIRVLSASEEQRSAFDVAYPNPWDFLKSETGFALDNTWTMASAWER